MSAELVQTDPASWRDIAACRGTDPAIFFKDDESRNGQYRKAKLVCSRCPVTQECLEDALRGESWLRFGVYGGMTPRERQWEARHRGLPVRTHGWGATD